MWLQCRPVIEETTARPVERRPIGHGGPGRFVTRFLYDDLLGHPFVWHSRRNRKGLGPEPAAGVGRTRPTRGLIVELRSVTWWIGVLFMIGASLFAIGSCGMWLDPTFTGAPVLFTGSLFFTAAAYLQFFELINEPHPYTAVRPHVVLFSFEANRIAWWATLIQLVGTLFFNISTFEAIRAMDPVRELELEWTPNVLGSVCFLVASYLAYAEVSNGWWSLQPRNISWWIVVINLAGSLAFGISAVAAYVIPSTAGLLDASLSNATTFLGAICFFAGAYLLIPEMTAHAAEPVEAG